MNLFTAPKRSKGVLRYIDEVITHTAETARKTKQTNQRSRQESKMISFQRKPLNTESSIELCLDSSITRVVVRRLRRLRRRSTREKSIRRSRAFPSLSLTRFTSLIVTEIRWYGQVCFLIGVFFSLSLSSTHLQQTPTKRDIYKNVQRRTGDNGSECKNTPNGSA